MVRHSKNNTASGVFTYAERQMVDYGTKSRRLDSDSKRRFDACYLCLNEARTPMVCPKGHLTCKECVLQDILEQKQSIAQAKREYAEYIKREELKAEKEKKLCEEEIIKEYVRTEVGLRVSRDNNKRKPTEDEQEMLSVKRPLDNKVRLIEDKSMVIAAASGPESDGIKPTVGVYALAKSNALITKPGSSSSVEKVDGKASVTKQEKKDGSGGLTSFWVPSLAPETQQKLKEPSKRQVECRGSQEYHEIKMKNLVEVQFRQQKSDKLCPCCDKVFTNSTKIDVLLSCGHALCHGCVGNFVTPVGVCFVCQSKVRNVVRLQSEGTGFTAAGGQMVASRYSSALQA